jgi:hypothetical protein
MKFFLSFLLCFMTLLKAQDPVGIFENHMDIGHPKMQADRVMTRPASHIR